MMSENVNELFSALSKAQSELTVAINNKENPHFRSKFANLQSYFSACRAPLSKNGLCVIQTIEDSESKHYLITTLGHASGQWMKSKMPINAMKNDMQAFGSALSYAKRYALGAIIGLASGEEDDDGNEAIEEKPSSSSKTVRLEPNKISADQFTEIMELISRCDKEFSMKVLAYIKAKGATGWADMPATLFNDVKNKAIKNIEENRNGSPEEKGQVG